MLQALARELAEEGNIRLGSASRVCMASSSIVAPPSGTMSPSMWCRISNRTGPFKANREITVASFFALDALPNDTTAGTRARIAEVMGGAPVSEHW